MKARYINVEEYNKVLMRWVESLERLTEYRPYDDKIARQEIKSCKNFFKEIRDTPADIVEVKYGYWKDRYGDKYHNHLYECSVCGKEALYEFYKNELDQRKERQALTPICPYCSAKMDGGEQDGTL